MTGEPSVALVTGANRGIGKEVCRQLHDLGYTVLLGCRNLDAGRSAARELSTSDTIEAVHLDVASDASVATAAEHVRDRHGRLDVLVNNAAIMYDSHASGIDADLTAVHRAFETNLFGAWRTIQAFLPLLRKSAHGRIVNVSSEAGSLASMEAGTPAYATSKAALNALTRIVAAELSDDQVLVNAVCPGWTATDMGGGGGRPVHEGASSIVWAVTLDDDGASGGFFRDGKPLRW